VAGRPPIRYASSGSVQVAYQVTGDGPVDMVLAPGTASHLGMDWEWPPRARLLESLSSFCRLIRFDKRGTGLSDRPTGAATLEERTDDIRAVMDAAGSEQAAILGVSEGGSMACLFAATYPERTRALLTWGAQARWTRAPDYPWGQTAEQEQAMLDVLRGEWPSVEYITGPGAGLGTQVDPEFLEWFLRYLQAGASPSAIVAIEELNAQIDVRGILPTIQVPTLVMNRTGDPVAHVDAARDLAAHIPGARFVEFPGDTHNMLGPEYEQVLAEIERFVTGSVTTVLPTRALATLVFLDVVGSTERAQVMGDVAWSDLIARFYRAAEDELATFGGVEVDRAGDSLLARFDGPTRAIRFARALQLRALALGLPLRAGVHTGEVEVAGKSVRGIAVHVAARIAALAGADEVFVSGTVTDLVAGSGLQFEDRGLQVLKGLADPRRVSSLVSA
jgi:pimeloyl-ACP methyl ester carboxylesterase